MVKSLCREFLTWEDQSLLVELVKMEYGSLKRATRLVESLSRLPQDSLTEKQPVEVIPGDILFMLDSSWVFYADFLPEIKRIHAGGGKVVTMVYDLIPIRHPETCHASVLNVFESWLKMAIQESDLLICISESVALDLETFLNSLQIPLINRPKITFFHLGSDIPVLLGGHRELSASVKKLFASKEPVFLMVGTLEPRKGHSFVLDAFELLWAEGFKYKLCLVGKEGWNVEGLLNRINTHPEFNRSLFYYNSISDAELNESYSSAAALITASMIEGFGLPIVEGTLHHLPVLASDIPVFREVGGDGALYFSLNDPSDLAEKVKLCSTFSVEERKALAEKVKILTWKESAEQVLKLLETGEK